MVSNITLTSPIRSNLLSLTNIAKQMDKTQLILATGKKVNTALDNASAYYQARSLTNRSADLNALLDAMDQGIQTIEAASQGIETATSLLEQMQSITTQAGAVGQALSKEDLQGLVGANGAVVETADELRAAINSGKETICVYGNIDLGDITDTGSLTLKTNQKLVGAGYFGDNVTASSISATSTVGKNLITITQPGCEVSDLSIKYDSNTTESSYAIYVTGNNTTADLKNLDIEFNVDDFNSNYKSAIRSYNGAIANLYGDINIKTSGNLAIGIFSSFASIININSDAKININTAGGGNAWGVFIQEGASFNVKSGAKVDINTAGEHGFGIAVTENGVFNADKGSEILIQTSNRNSGGLLIRNHATSNLGGKVMINTLNGHGIRMGSDLDSGSKVNILTSAQIYFNIGGSTMHPIVQGSDGGNGPNILNIAQGAKLAFEKDGNVKWYEQESDYNDINDSGSNNYITANNITTMIPGITETTPWTLPTGIETDAEDNTAKKNIAEYQSQFNSVLGEYNKLINDCSYQGINLLKGGNLKVVFNEHRSHVFNVLGQDITAAAIGLNEALWQTTGDINQSVSELTQAITTLRSLAESLGNQYSIIQTRADFTEGLTDILETGADELTLADMNEASAQYLSLQTRQQLALNSLSLAALSAQSVLSLFY